MLRALNSVSVSKLLRITLWLLLLPLGGCGQGVDSVPPSVSNVNPTNNDSNVAVNTAVSLTFSQPVENFATNTGFFTLSGPGGMVNGALNVTGATATFTPANNLRYNSRYTAIVSGVRDVAGNAMSSQYSWSFTTGAEVDTVAPQVTSTSPSNNAAVAAVNAAVSVTFSEAMKASTVTPETFIITGPDGVVAGTVAFSGATATFTPADSLAYGATYEATITRAVQDLSGNGLAGTVSWTFTTGSAPSSVSPQVANTSPANNATGVGVNGAITANFSEALNPATVTTASFTVANSNAIAGTVTYGGNTATFTPYTALAYNTTYIATISTATKDLVGNALADNYAWTFTTGPLPDTAPPTLLSTNPVAGAIQVEVGSYVTVTFSEEMDASTLTPSTIVLKDAANNAVVGSVTYSPSTATATFTPSVLLAYGATYRLNVVGGSGGVKDLAGNAPAINYNWTFATEPEPDATSPMVVGTSPPAGATRAEPGSAVTATFSEAMNGATLSASSFTLVGPGGPVVGSVGYSGLTATFSTTNALDTNTSYTATITSHVKDMVGNALVSNHVWGFNTRPFTRQLGSKEFDTGSSVATDVNGYIYVAGETRAGLDGNANAGNTDAFVAKYDSSGAKQWIRQFGTVENDSAHSLATDASGNVFVAGRTNGSLDGNTNPTGEDIFIVKYDSGGMRHWTRQIDSGLGLSVATDANGNAFVAGYTWGSLDGNPNAGYQDVFVIKFDTNGGRAWTRQFGTDNYDIANGIATDPAGNVYVTGYTARGLDGNTNVGNTDLFLVKYDTSGVKKWTRQLGSAAHDFANSVATDVIGSVYVAGYTEGGLDGNANSGDSDVFVVKYGSDGAKQWTRQLGTAGYDVGSGVATDTSGAVYVTGGTVGDLDGNANAGGGADIFVVKYDSAGVKQWTRLSGTAAADGAAGIATDASGNIYVTGSTSGSLDGHLNAEDHDVIVVKFDNEGNKK